MSKTSNPMAARRRLGTELRRLREAIGLSGEQAAAEFGWSQAKISRMESAVTRPTVRDVRDLIVFYEADNVVKESLLELAAVAATRNPAWWNDYAGAISVRTRQRIALEADAARIQQFAPSVLPGLLQTNEYARAVYERTGVEYTRRNVDLAVACRATRKEFVMRQPPDLQVLTTDTAIHWSPAGKIVQSRQLRELVQEVRETPSFLVRVLLKYPRDSALPLPDFMLCTFADPDVPVVGYVDAPTGFFEVEKAVDIAFYEESFRELMALALTPEESLEYVLDTANNMH